VKFQTFFADSLVTKTAKKSSYQINNDPLTSTQKEMLERLELTKEDHLLLFNHAKECGIKFLSSGF
jgi:sialic acid synthase SpsE